MSTIEKAEEYDMKNIVKAIPVDETEGELFAVFQDENDPSKETHVKLTGIGFFNNGLIRYLEEDEYNEYLEDKKSKR